MTVFVQEPCLPPLSLLVRKLQVSGIVSVELYNITQCTCCFGSNQLLFHPNRVIGNRRALEQGSDEVRLEKTWSSKSFVQLVQRFLVCVLLTLAIKPVE